MVESAGRSRCRHQTQRGSPRRNPRRACGGVNQMSVTYFRASTQPVFSAVATVGLPVWESPFDNVTDRLVFRQRFIQTAASYSPSTMNVTYPAHGSYGVPTSTSFYLVEESGFRDEREYYEPAQAAWPIDSSRACSARPGRCGRWCARPDACPCRQGTPRSRRATYRTS